MIELDPSLKTPLYEQLYAALADEIRRGDRAPGTPLPGRRTMAAQQGVSVNTVDTAYQMLAAEGLAEPRPRSGFYVQKTYGMLHTRAPRPALRPAVPAVPAEAPVPLFDLSTGSVDTALFPARSWGRIQKELLYQRPELLQRGEMQGDADLRGEIAQYLSEYRGVECTPGQIVVGAGTEYLYSVLIQLLGRQWGYAVEDPGYLRLSKIYEKNDVATYHIPMDEHGIIPEKLEESGAEILHITPSHHFPTGIVMPVSRRYEFLSWASKGENRYIIEDDYDCEFRLAGRPIPTLQSIDVMEKVIYINTFSKSLAPAFRISYLVLPKHLVTRFYDTLGFYSGTVSCLEQMTLARFLSEGYFEKHINRMRNHYRALRDKLLAELRQSPLAGKVRISEENAGLHFLLELDTQRSDEDIRAAAEREDLRLSFVSQYYVSDQHRRPHVLVMNYSGLEERQIPEAVARLCRAVEG